MRWLGAARSLLSKTPPVSQLGGVVWSASKRTAGRFSPKVSPEVTAFEFAVSRPSLVARLIPALSSDDNTQDHGWPWKPVIVIAAGAALLQRSITHAESDEESGDESDAGTADRDRRALLHSEPPAGQSVLEWGVELVTEHKFKQTEVCEYHDLAQRTLLRCE